MNIVNKITKILLSETSIFIYIGFILVKILLSFSSKTNLWSFPSFPLFLSEIPQNIYDKFLFIN